MNSAASTLLTASLLLTAASHGRAQLPYTAHTLRAGGSAASPAATLTSVAWLPGRWLGEGLGAMAEEVWLPAAGGAMVGAFRLVQDGEVRFYELVTLVEEDGTLVMRLKHFRPDLVGWEDKEKRVEFPLLRADDRTLWFDGLTMRRIGVGDEMEVWVALERSGESVEEARFGYRRVRSP